MANRSAAKAPSFGEVIGIEASGCDASGSRLDPSAVDRTDLAELAYHQLQVTLTAEDFLDSSGGQRPAGVAAIEALFADDLLLGGPFGQ